MPDNKKQHLVSRFVIKQFLAGGCRLFCLDKQTLKVADRSVGNLPKDILHESYYYTTDDDDFDSDIVKPLESRLASWLMSLVTQHEIAAGASHAWEYLAEWFALSLTRSIYLGDVAPTIFNSLSADEQADFPADTKGMILATRRSTFDWVKQQLYDCQVGFRFLKAPGKHGYYLTDYPLCPIPYDRKAPLGPALLPLSYEYMLAAVPAELTEPFYAKLTPTFEWLTLMQCGWARRLIYSHSLEALDFAAWVLTEGSGSYGKAMHKHACMPYFGLADKDYLEELLPGAD